MVREFGLSTELGPVGYATGQPQYLGERTEEPLRRPYSEHTQQVVDEEASRLLREAEQRAISLLRAHRPALDRLARPLLEHETIDGNLVLAVLADQHRADGQATRGPATAMPRP